MHTLDLGHTDLSSGLVIKYSVFYQNETRIQDSLYRTIRHKGVVSSLDLEM